MISLCNPIDSFLYAIADPVSVILFFFYFSFVPSFLQNVSLLPPARPKRWFCCWQGHEKAAGSLCLECLQVINSASSYPQPFSSAKWLNALALNGKPLLMPLAQTSPFAPLSLSIATSQISLFKSAKIYILCRKVYQKKMRTLLAYFVPVVCWWRPCEIHFLVKAKKIFGFH